MTRWVQGDEDLKVLPISYLGISTGAAAALRAASHVGADIRAVVSLGGRPDLTGERLARVVSPTLLIVGGAEWQVLGLNEQAAELLTCEHEIAVVPGATHLFEEPGALDRVARLAGELVRALLRGRRSERATMNWSRSIRIGRLAGIPIGVQPMWLLVVALMTALLGATYYPEQISGIAPVVAYALAFLSVLLLFAAILLHELGHAVVARRRGVEIEEIDLWLLGGVSRMKREPRRGPDELRFAAAGPAVTLVIALCFGASRWRSHPRRRRRCGPWSSTRSTSTRRPGADLGEDRGPGAGDPDRRQDRPRLRLRADRPRPAAIVPVETMPAWLQPFAGHQPVSVAIDAVRALMQGEPIHSWVLRSLA